MLLGLFLFLFGAVHGAMDVAMNAWAAEVERRGTRRLMAGFHAMFSLGAGIGALSGYLAVLAGLSLLAHFALASALLFAATYGWARIDWTSDRAERTSGAIFAWPTGPLLLVGVVAFCSSLGEGAMADWSAVYLRDVGQVSEGTAALGYAVFSVAMVVMRLLGDRVAGAFGPVNAARWGGVSAFVGVSLAVLVPQPGMILLGFALLGLGYAVIVPLAFSRAANDPAIPPGQAISSVATLGYGGMLLGPPVIGFVASIAGLQVAFGGDGSAGRADYRTGAGAALSRFFLRNHFLQHLRVSLGPLRTGQQVLAIKHHRRHARDAARRPELLMCADLFGLRAGLQNLAGGIRIQTDVFGDLNQNLGVRNVQTLGKMRVKERHFERILLVLRLRPAQQLMRGKGVHDAAVVRKVERETETFAQLCQPRAIGGRLFRRRAVFLRQMLCQVLALRWHGGIEFKRVPADVGPGTCHAKRLFQLFEAHNAPGAHHVRDDIDLNNGAILRGLVGHEAPFGRKATTRAGNECDPDYRNPH